MKKIISLFLAAAMLMSLAVPTFAYPTSVLKTDPETGEHYEEFIFERKSYRLGILGAVFEGENFDIETNKYVSPYEISCGGSYYLKVYPKEGKNFYITRVEARVSSYGSCYSKVGVSAGDKREKGNVDNGNIVHIDDINKSEFAFANGTDFVSISLLRVYYEEGTPPTGFTLSNGNLWIIGAGAVAILGGVAAVIIAKKKKKAAVAVGVTEEVAEAEEKEEK